MPSEYPSKKLPVSPAEPPDRSLVRRTARDRRRAEERNADNGDGLREIWEKSGEDIRDWQKDDAPDYDISVELNVVLW